MNGPQEPRQAHSSEDSEETESSEGIAMAPINETRETGVASSGSCGMRIGSDGEKADREESAGHDEHPFSAVHE